MKYKSYVNKISEALAKYKKEVDTLEGLYIADKEKIEAKAESMKGKWTDEYIRQYCVENSPNINSKARFHGARSRVEPTVLHYLEVLKKQLDNFFNAPVNPDFANKIMMIKLSGLQLSDMEFRVLQESASSYMECRLLNQLADTRTKEGYVIEIGENGEAQQEQRTLRNPYTLLNLPNIEETYKAFGEYVAAVKGLLYSYSGVNAKIAHLLDKPTPGYVSVAMDSYFRNHHEEAFTKVMEKANSILPESKVKRELTENDKKLIDTLIDCKYPSLCKERVKTLAEADATIGSLLELDERYAKFLEE